jgi:hypothetical protein
VVVRQTMTVAAQHLQVCQIVVLWVAVHVVQLQRHWVPQPLCAIASFAYAFLETLFEQTFL